MKREVDAQPCSSQGMSLGTIRHRLGSPRAAAHRRRPYMIPGREPPAREPPIVQELMQRMEHLRSVMNNVIRTILVQTGGIPDDASTVKAHQAAISNPNDILGGNLAHRNTMTTAAGRPSVMQGGGASSQQPRPQSTSPTPSFGTHPAVGDPSSEDQRRFTGPVARQLSPFIVPNIAPSTQLIPQSSSQT
ncbi:uncharacterized protein EDB91DRAFT_1254403 [Suillus paluster]|uniref:uncharacterized protein n=1 Tax=Suillus paluster TaxID=48578 RepID=UPI001B88606F|nr:uncharacterized protein EDB91DRAFT_1254403 [Suillus paluster]KAG1726261.1 hypothetical protein EDB91DRAFT_1254403 [Suillus paluster]